MGKYLEYIDCGGYMRNYYPIIFSGQHFPMQVHGLENCTQRIVLNICVLDIRRYYT